MDKFTFYDPNDEKSKKDYSFDNIYTIEMDGKEYKFTVFFKNEREYIEWEPQCEEDPGGGFQNITYYDIFIKSFNGLDEDIKKKLKNTIFENLKK